MARILRYRMGQPQAGRTVQDVLRREHGFSSTLIRSLKTDPGGALLNGAPVRMVDRLRAGDKLVIALPSHPVECTPNPALRAPILYRDPDVLVFDKPPGMPVHPSHGHREDTLLNRFAAVCPGEEFHPVYRLDMDTSGLCAVALHSLAASLLPGTARKEYLALLCGELPSDQGVIDAPIAREEGSAIKRRVAPGGKPSLTRYRVVDRQNGFTAVAVRLETGRTHQIRVHFAHLGFPLAGDWLYGGDTSVIPRHALHCRRLWFVHPVTGQPVELHSPLPKDMAEVYGLIV